MEIVIVTALAVCEAQLSFAAEIYSLEHQKYILCFFFHCDGWLRDLGFGFPPIYISVKQEAMDG